MPTTAAPTAPTDVEIDELIAKAADAFCLTEIGPVGGTHTAWAAIGDHSVLVADLIAALRHTRTQRDNATT